jgi:hypothetical protein
MRQHLPHLFLLHPQQHLLRAEGLVVGWGPRLQHTQQPARPAGHRVLLLLLSCSRCCFVLLLLLLLLLVALLLVNIHACFLPCFTTAIGRCCCF